MLLMTLKKGLLAAALVGLGTVPTFAADLAARPYTKAPALAAVYDWTGFYIGVNAGVGIGRDRFQHDFLGTGSGHSFYAAPQGGFGGGQVGYNWQMGSFFGPIVFGLEADIQGAGLSDDRPTFNEAGALRNYNQKLDWFGTARGRIGFAKGPVLGYFTAGYAFANIKTGASGTLGGVTNTFANERMQGGWVFGSGVEAALGGNWTGKIEYLRLDLGNHTDIAALGAATPIHTELREHIFRAGLNYRIGGTPYAPVAAANWAGFYLGGNFGSGIGRDRSTLNQPAIGSFQTFNLAPEGKLGGVQAGFNWQAANWVYGLEADIQGSTQKDNKTCVLSCTAGGPTAAYDATLPWLATVRGRLGYSVGSTLFYATGGLAYGSIKTKIATTSVAGTVTQSFSHTNAGWTAGAGIETPFKFMGLLGPNWTTKAEYLYVDLGSTSDNFAFGATPATATRSVTEHVFRTGINYHFNSPVVAKY